MLKRFLQIIPTLTTSSKCSFQQQNMKSRVKGSAKSSLDGQVKKWSKYRMSEFSSYFQQKSALLDQQTKLIIEQLNHQSPHNRQIYSKVQDYLKAKQKKNFQQSSPLAKIYLLVAIEMRRNFHPHQLQELSRLILQHIIRHPIQNLLLDSQSLEIVVRNLCKFSHKVDEKYKLNVIIYLVMNSLTINFGSIPEQFYPFIVSFINSNLKSNSLNSLKYLKFITLLQHKLNNILVSILGGDQVSEQYKFVFYGQFIKELLQLCGVYGLQHQYTQNLYQFLIRKYFSTKLNNPSQAIHTLNIIYRNFPYQNQHKDCKLLILQYIIFLQTSSPQMSEEINKESLYLCYSILTHFFHSHFRALHLQQENGFAYFPSSSVLAPPQLPSIFWKLYNANAGIINAVPILMYTIKNCYPQKYIEKGEQGKNVRPLVDTQMYLRVQQSLARLQLKFKTQQCLAGRFIDFYLQERNIVLQVDGVIHFEPQSLTSNDSTNYRNWHLILSGYKLMTISIYEYNICREIQELSELINAKLALLQEKALYVR